MTAVKKGIVLCFVILCPGLAISSIIVSSYNSISMDLVENMAIDEFTTSNGYSYTFVNGARDITDGSDFDAVRSAFQTWIDEPSSSLWSAENTAQKAFTLGQMNYQNNICWVSATATDSDPWSNVLNLSDSVIAVVMTWYNAATGVVIESDIYFNDVDMRWRTDSDGQEEGGYSVEHIALHEIGHVFGLDDVYNPWQTGWEEWMGSDNEGLTMYGYSSWLDNDVTLSQADIAAMALLHPSVVPEARSFSLFGLAAGIFLVTRRR